MKRLLSVCFAMIITFALLTAVYAEGVDSTLNEAAEEQEIISGMIEPEVSESEDLALTGDSFSTDIQSPEVSASEDRAVSASMPKAGNCAHKKYSKIKGAYKRYSQLDSKKHSVTSYAPDSSIYPEATFYFVKCDACGETGFWYKDEWDQRVTWESENEAFYYEYSLFCNRSEYTEAHTFANGKCSKCGCKGNSSANDDMPVLCATRMNMGKGDILKLASSKKGYTFSSSDNKVARISKEGVITAVSVGKATITVKSKGGQKATCKVTVLKGPKKVTLNKSQVTLEKGKTCQLKATLPKGTHTWNLTWTSSNKGVAKVSSKGKVTAVGKGTAKITVETAGGVKATCKVTVKTSKKRIELTDYLDDDIRDAAKKLGLKGEAGQKLGDMGFSGDGISIGQWGEPGEIENHWAGIDSMRIFSDPKSRYSIRGCYIGMKVDDAIKRLKKEGAYLQSISEEDSYMSVVKTQISDYGNEYTEYGLWIEFDSSRRLKFIEYRSN